MGTSNSMVKTSSIQNTESKTIKCYTCPQKTVRWDGEIFRDFCLACREYIDNYPSYCVLSK